MRRPFLGLSRDNFLILLSMFFWGGGAGLWFFLQPLYLKSLGADPVQTGFVLSVAPAALLFTFIPAGIFADRYSRRKIILVGAAMGTVAVLLLAFARDWRQSILGFLLYYGSTYCMPAIYAYVAHASDGQNLNRTFTLVYSGYTLGLTLFPAVGGWLAERAGYGAVFGVSGAFLALSTIVVWLAKEQPVSPAQSSLGFREVLANRRLLAISLFVVPLFLALYLGQPFAPNYLQEVTGIELFWIGMLGSVHALGATVLTLWLGRISEGGAGLIVGQGLVFVSLLIFVRFEALSLLALSFFLRGAFEACRSLATAQIGKVVSSGSAGLAFGIFNTAYFLSTVLAPYLAGWLYASRPDLPFLLSAGMIPVMMVFSFALIRGDRG